MSYPLCYVWPRMNKSKSQFAALSEDDRKYILKLCSEHSYDDAVDLLLKPRGEGGLDILTSRAALCRFFTSAPDNTNHALAQYAAAANIRHEQNSNAFLGAIRASVEARVLENLRNGRALADMEKEFRFLKTAENLYLADAQWRAANPKPPAPRIRHTSKTAPSPATSILSLLPKSNAIQKLSPPWSPITSPNLISTSFARASASNTKPRTAPSSLPRSASARPVQTKAKLTLALQRRSSTRTTSALIKNPRNSTYST